ncbi:hypothetical protein DVS28_a0891 [Euzebya pacifica]|uniref:Methyltransferase type 11 domain-containing protein n=1 Tax=Euzebya pacifica TaxID=1608957 RepID=A0A346XTP5_9ACTN|nr:class I SAM-dependent methyltransferase [Euzebya pacifica]AXV05592.1 hypothetical protein DVS28_a0891 [Euzebya pacifica]
MSITWLDPIAPETMPDDVVAMGERHPMRTVTHAAAAEVGVWQGDTPGMVQRWFDELAGEWHTHASPDRLLPLVDALERGGPIPDHGTWLELGCGDGWMTSTLAERAPRLIATDLSWEMVRRVPTGPTPVLQADAAHLPLDDHAVTVAVLVNMLLFPWELDRVIAPGGVLVWLSSRGPATPIHLTPEQVAAAMPGRWGGMAGQHGTGIWTVLRRLG